MRAVVRTAAMLALVLAAGACGDDDADPAGTDPTSSTAPPVDTSTTTAPTTTTMPPPAYGSVCEPGSHPDCIDPDGDGQYEYLQDGAECLHDLGDTGLCTDLDGDGVAGYPDSG